MENASKALIIAGAILISILLIGLGVGVYQMAATTTNKANLNSQEAQAQNNQFEATFGKNKTASEVKSLMSTVRANNNTNKEEGTKIYIYFEDGYYDTSYVSKNVKAGITYDIDVANDTACEYKDRETAPTEKDAPAYYDNGYIRIITITKSTGE